MAEQQVIEYPTYSEPQIIEQSTCLESHIDTSPVTTDDDSYTGDGSPGACTEGHCGADICTPEHIPGHLGAQMHPEITTEKIVCKIPVRPKRKIDTSICPAVRAEITRLTRIFDKWVPPDTKISERNKINMNDTQLQAVLYARERHVTPVQIAGVLGISVYRVHHIIKHAKTIRKRQQAGARRQSSLNNFSGSPPDAPAQLDRSTEEPLVLHIQKKLVIKDISPRI